MRDTVRAYILLGKRGQTGRAYNVCRGHAFQIRELLEVLIGFSRIPVRVVTDPTRMRPSDNPVVLGDYSRLREETGWTPQIPIERTLSDLLGFWRARLSR